VWVRAFASSKHNIKVGVAYTPAARIYYIIQLYNYRLAGMAHVSLQTVANTILISGRGSFKFADSK